MKKYRNIQQHLVVQYMHLLGNGMYNKSYHNEHMSFCHKMCNVVNTRFFMTISHFNENNDLGSSKALKWVLIKSSFFSKGLFFTIIMLFVLKSSKQDLIFERTVTSIYLKILISCRLLGSQGILLLVT